MFIVGMIYLKNQSSSNPLPHWFFIFAQNLSFRFSGGIATGAGKTYMSAFDVAQVNPNRMLFLVHREDILYRAKETFEYVLGKTGKKMGIYTSNVKEVEADYLFSTVQTMSRHFKNYARDSFDYLIVDEAHHIGGETYQQLLNEYVLMGTSR